MRHKYSSKYHIGKKLKLVHVTRLEAEAELAEHMRTARPHHSDVQALTSWIQERDLLKTQLELCDDN